MATSDVEAQLDPAAGLSSDVHAPAVADGGRREGRLGTRRCVGRRRRGIVLAELPTPARTWRRLRGCAPRRNASHGQWAKRRGAGLPRHVPRSRAWLKYRDRPPSVVRGLQALLQHPDDEIQSLSQYDFSSMFEVLGVARRPVGRRRRRKSGMGVPARRLAFEGAKRADAATSAGGGPRSSPRKSYRRFIGRVGPIRNRWKPSPPTLSGWLWQRMLTVFCQSGPGLRGSRASTLIRMR